MADYSDQIGFAIAMAWTVSTALYVLAVLIGIFIYTIFVIVTLLTILATAICIAAGTIVGAPAALELEAQANQFAAMAHRVLSVLSTVVEKVSVGVAILWGVLLGTNATGQFFNGNPDVMATLGKATLNGADDMLKGALAYLLTKRTAEVFGKSPVSPLGVPLTSRVGALTTPEKLAAGLGSADTLNGSNVLATPWENTGKSYGSEDDAGRKYVDETQPHR